MIISNSNSNNNIGDIYVRVQMFIVAVQLTNLILFTKIKYPSNGLNNRTCTWENHYWLLICSWDWDIVPFLETDLVTDWLVEIWMHSLVVFFVQCIPNFCLFLAMMKFSCFGLHYRHSRLTTKAIMWLLILLGCSGILWWQIPLENW